MNLKDLQNLCIKKGRFSKSVFVFGILLLLIWLGIMLSLIFEIQLGITVIMVLFFTSLALGGLSAYSRIKEEKYEKMLQKKVVNLCEELIVNNYGITNFQMLTDSESEVCTLVISDCCMNSEELREIKNKVDELLLKANKITKQNMQVVIV